MTWRILYETHQDAIVDAACQCSATTCMAAASEAACESCITYLKMLTNLLGAAVEYVAKLHDGCVAAGPDKTPVHLLNHAGQLEQRDGLRQVAVDIAHCTRCGSVHPSTCHQGKAHVGRFRAHLVSGT